MFLYSNLHIIPLSYYCAFLKSADQDYIAVSPHTVSLNHSSLTDEIPVRIIDDSTLEQSSESFLVILTTDSPGVSVLGHFIAAVVVLDNDSKKIKIPFISLMYIIM